jgi:hypothetical protein
LIKLKKILGTLKSKSVLVFFRNEWSNFKAGFKSYANINFKFRNLVQKKHKTVLVCTFSGDNYLIKIIDILFYQSFKIRGYKIYVLNCDRSLNLCMVSDYSRFKKKQQSIKKSQENICKFCVKGFKNDFIKNFFELINVSDFIKKDTTIKDKEKILAKCNIRNFNFSDTVSSATIRFLGKSKFSHSNTYEKYIYREYLLSSLKFLYAFNEIIKKYKINLIINHHGIYVPHGLILNYSKSNRIDNYSWSQGYKKKSIILVRNNNVHNFFPNVANWDKFEFSINKKKKIIKYLKSREINQRDWVQYQNNKLKKNLEKNNFFDNNNLIYILYANVSWDAKLHFTHSLFNNMEEFVIFTIKFFINNPQKNLIIKSHPGELLSQVPSAETIKNFIERKFKAIPKNIKIIDSASDINSFQLAKISNIAIVYSSKISIELSSVGMPVICCGDAWIKNKKITLDPKSKSEYLNILNAELKTLNEISLRNSVRAQKFAFYFFFRKTIQIKSISTQSFFPKYISDMSKLNSDNNMNKIVDLIIKNREVEFEQKNYNT